jgi:hypothetical protein
MAPPATAACRSRRRRGALALVGLAAGVGLSGPAWALCPNCLGQRPSLTPTLELVGLFLLVPFAVAGAVYLVLRRTIYGRGAPPSGAPPSLAPPSPPPPSLAPPSSGGGVQAG